jgi:hypothetical protein
VPPYPIDHTLVLDEVRRLCGLGAWVTAERVAASLGRLSEGDDIAASVRIVLDDLVVMGDLEKGPPPWPWSSEPAVAAYRPVPWH